MEVYIFRDCVTGQVNSIYDIVLALLEISFRYIERSKELLIIFLSEIQILYK